MGICQIRADKAPSLQNEALADSITAIFVPDGSSNAYRSQEKWKTFAFVEGEPTSVKVQISRMGSLEPGKRANVVVLDQNLELKDVFFRGELVDRG